MIRKYLEIARNTIGQATLAMRGAILVSFGKMKTALSSKIQGLKAYLLAKMKRP